MRLLAIMETDVPAIRIKSARGGFAAMRPRGAGGWEGVRGGGGVHGSKNSALGDHSGSFWHHLGCTLTGLKACLEHSQGQALIGKSCCAQHLWKVGHVEQISVILASPSLPPTTAVAGVLARVAEALGCPVHGLW